VVAPESTGAAEAEAKVAVNTLPLSESPEAAFTEGLDYRYGRGAVTKPQLAQ
jgi:hypothetical protein